VAEAGLIDLELEPAHAGGFRLAVLAQLTEDGTMKTELETFYKEDCSGIVPPAVAAADKYAAAAKAVWVAFMERWKQVSTLEPSAETVGAFVSFVQEYPRNLTLQLLLVERMHRIAPAAVVNGGGVEAACAALLASVPPPSDADAEQARSVGELAVILFARLVESARSETLLLLKGPDFIEAVNRVWRSFQDSPRILAALCFVLEAVAVKVVKWQITFDDGSTWKDLDDQLTMALRKATSKGERTLHFDARGFPYVIDLDRGVQENLKTFKSRPIREIEVDMGTSSTEEDKGGDDKSGDSVDVPQLKWQVSGGKDKWWDIPQEVGDLLSAAQAAGNPLCSFNVRGNDYEVDFAKMVQCNVATGTERSVRALPA